MKTPYLKMILVTAVIALLSVNTNCQDKNPQVPPQVKNLMKFLGRWEANATLTSQGKIYKGLYWVNCKKTADGNGIFAEEGFSNPEMGKMSGADLAGFDPYDSKIKWFSVDNMGTTHEHTGDWESPDHLIIEHYGTRDGKKYIEKIDFTFKTKEVMEFKLSGTLDGVEIEKGEGIFYRKPANTK
jgi:hypothetical protein